MKKVFGILLILIIAALIFALIYFKGFGGFGKDSGENKKKDDTSVSETTEKKTEATTEPTTEEKTEEKTASVTVSGRDYIFGNEKVSLEKLAAEIAKLDKETKISITYDDTAAKNTMDDLTDKLDELGYKNYEKIAK